MKRPWSLCTVLLIPLSFALLVLALCAGAGGRVWAARNIRCVNRAGTECSAICGGGCYASLQGAVDAAVPGDEIRVAGGTYIHPGGTVATISKELHIIGGYDPSGEFHNPELYTTVLDARGNGSVVRIVGAGDVVLSLLTLTHGNGTGNCDNVIAVGCGGGLYVAQTNLHVLNCLIVDNVASDAAGGAAGGGIYAVDSPVEIRDSRILGNTAGTPASDYYGNGGGIYVLRGEVDLVNNEVRSNLGSYDYSGSGGIELVEVAYARVMGNTIEGNRSTQTGDYWAGAGGLQLSRVGYADVIANRVESNGCSGPCYGGGIYVEFGSAHLSRNVVIGNKAGEISTGAGAGISILGTHPVTMSNNLIAGNDAGGSGGGVYVEGRGPECQARFYNNTIAGNGTYAIYGSQEGSMLLINNLVAGHGEGIHIQLPFNGTIDADTNLFWNQSDPIVGAHAIRQDPHLLPDGRLGAGSPAVDAGLDVPWLVVDLVGQPRPAGGGWDLGAFEGAQGSVYLPAAFKGFSSTWEGCGDSREGACPIGGCGTVLQAYPDDTDDWYAFDLGAVRTLTVSATNLLPQAQLVLYDSAGGYLAHDGSSNSTKTVSYSLQRGYVRVYTPSGHNTTTLYALTLSCSGQ